MGLRLSKIQPQREHEEKMGARPDVGTFPGRKCPICSLVAYFFTLSLLFAKWSIPGNLNKRSRTSPYRDVP